MQRAIRRTFRGKLSAAEVNSAGAASAYVSLTRDAKYTAYVQYYGGYALGMGYNAQTAVSVATSSCANESA